MTFKTRIENHGKGPTIFVNGQPTHLGGVGRACQRKELPSLLGADISASCLLWPQAFFHVGDQPDIPALIEQYKTLLASQPNALLSTVITLAPSANWAARHPQEMTRYDLQADLVKPANASRSPEPSWASAVWRKEAADFLRMTIGELHEALDGRIVHYQFGAGKCGENFPVPDPVRYGQWYCGDFSEPMQQWFRHWLRDRYADRDALRTAWSDPDADFDTAEVPPRDERLRSDWFSFRSPLRARVSDYYRAWSDAIETCILDWAAAIKQATNNEALTSSAIGGVLDCGLNADTLQHVKRHGMQRCLKSRDLDMLESPASYVLRDLGHGDTTAMIPVGSLALHGKLWFRDLDSRTSRCANTESQDPSSVLWTAPRNTWQDEQLLKRDAGYSIVKGGSWWWHEIVPDMFAEPVHRKLAQQIGRVAQNALRFDRTPATGLAVLVDPASDYALSNANRLIFSMNYEARRRHWTRTGMASEIYLLDDIAHPDMLAHPVIMVTNAFAITDEQAAAVKRKADKTNATLIWLVAPGVAGPGEFDTQRTSEIVGMPIRAVDVETQPTIRILPSEHPWSRVQLHNGKLLETFGVGPRGKDDSAAYTFGPQFYADVDNADDITVLGLNETIARPGLVVKQEPTRRTVFCAAPYMHHALLHAIGRDSNAHLYAPPGHALHVSRELLVINAAYDTELALHLPAKCREVRELYEDAVLGSDVSQVALNAAQYQTHLLSFEV